MIVKLTTLGVGAYLLWQWATHEDQRAQRLNAQRMRAKPEEVTTWEGEGGALPVTGAQLGPDPARV